MNCRMKTALYRIAYGILLIVLTGCAVGSSEHSASTKEPKLVRTTKEVSTRSDAVTHLIEVARKRIDRSELNTAEETINRGLNLDPEHPVLWHLLAKIRFLEQQYDQTELLARRSLRYTSDNSKLSDDNWQLIADAWLRRGNETEAQRALDKVKNSNGARFSPAVSSETGVESSHLSE